LHIIGINQDDDRRMCRLFTSHFQQNFKYSPCLVLRVESTKSANWNWMKSGEDITW